MKELPGIPVLEEYGNEYEELITEEGVALWNVDIFTHLDDILERCTEITGLTRYSFVRDVYTMKDSLHLIFRWGDQFVLFAVVVMRFEYRKDRDHPRELCHFQGQLSPKQYFPIPPPPNPNLKPTRVFQGL